MTRAVQRFGGQHTELKLRVLSAYLTAYLKVMKKQNYRLTYIDAFAGTGWSRAGYRDDGRQADLLGAPDDIKGSALRVFDISDGGRPFDRYVFNDLRKTAMNKLRREIESAHPDIAVSTDCSFSPAPPTT